MHGRLQKSMKFSWHSFRLMKLKSNSLCSRWRRRQRCWPCSRVWLSMQQIFKRWGFEGNATANYQARNATSMRIWTECIAISNYEPRMRNSRITDTGSLRKSERREGREGRGDLEDAVGLESVWTRFVSRKMSSRPCPPLRVPSRKFRSRLS